MNAGTEKITFANSTFPNRPIVKKVTDKALRLVVVLLYSELNANAINKVIAKNKKLPAVIKYLLMPIFKLNMP